MNEGGLVAISMTNGVREEIAMGTSIIIVEEEGIVGNSKEGPSEGTT
jgi:hypothetical protein